jgi:hypothetical protein
VVFWNKKSKISPIFCDFLRKKGDFSPKFSVTNTPGRGFFGLKKAKVQVFSEAGPRFFLANVRRIGVLLAKPVLRARSRNIAEIEFCNRVSNVLDPFLSLFMSLGHM